MSRVRLDFALYGFKADAFAHIYNKTQLMFKTTISKPALVMVLIKAFETLPDEKQKEVFEKVMSGLKGTSKIEDVFNWTKDNNLLLKKG